MRLLDFLNAHSHKNSKQEELLYEFVAAELEAGSLRKGLWIKALTETGFDNARARALYIKLRIVSLQDELRESASQLKQIHATQSRLSQLLDQGCSQEAIDYIGNPIQVSTYMTKYGTSMDKLEKAISIKKIKGCLVDGCLWVQDTPI